MKILTEEKKMEIKSLLAEGLSYNEIVKKVGCSKSTISTIKNNGIVLYSTDKVPNSTDKVLNNTILEKYNTGLRMAIDDVDWLLKLMASPQFDLLTDFDKKQIKRLQQIQECMDNEYFTK